MGPIVTDREAKFAVVCFVLGVLTMPVLLGGCGYLTYRVIAAAWRGW